MIDTFKCINNIDYFNAKIKKYQFTFASNNRRKTRFNSIHLSIFSYNLCAVDFQSIRLVRKIWHLQYM